MSIKTGAHHCDACGAKAKVAAMSHWEGETRRQLECDCGERWVSIETRGKRLQPATTGCNPLQPATTGCNGLQPVESQEAVSPRKPPPSAAQPPAIERRGVGGVLPSDQVLVRSSDPDPSLSGNPDQTRARSGFRATTPRVFVAAKTAAFLDVFNRYPRRDKKERSAQIWQELAAEYPGGEEALKAAILARFATGLLKRAPYSGPNDKRPCLDTFLAERRWEDPESDPDTLRADGVAAGLDPRCLHHAKGWTSRPKTLTGGCPGCDAIEARERKARQDALAREDAFKAKPVDAASLPTMEQLQELRRSVAR